MHTGKYQKYRCNPSSYEDPIDVHGQADACVPCDACYPGSYRNPALCTGRGTTDIWRGDSQQCIPCRSCPDMHVIRDKCPGNTTYDTQTCEPCISNCPDNTFVNDEVCTGYKFADATVTVDVCSPCINSCDIENFQVYTHVQQLFIQKIAQLYNLY
jgi:ferredoxin